MEKKNSTMRFSLCALIIVLSLLALRPLYLRLMADIHSHQAGNCLREKFYGLAAEKLKKAGSYQPGDYRIKKKLGAAYNRLGNLRTRVREAWPLTV